MRRQTFENQHFLCKVPNLSGGERDVGVFALHPKVGLSEPQRRRTLLASYFKTFGTVREI
jgi:hypothetical protein